MYKPGFSQADNQTLTEPSLCLLSPTQASNLILILSQPEPGPKFCAMSLVQSFPQHGPADTRRTATAMEGLPHPNCRDSTHDRVPWPSWDMRDAEPSLTGGGLFRGDTTAEEFLSRNLTLTLTPLQNST